MGTAVRGVPGPMLAAQRPSAPSTQLEEIYLQPGPRNRLVLSLCSDIPSQVNWAFARLAAYSQQLGDRFLLADYPGLDEVLMSYVQRLCAALRGEPRSEWDASNDQDEHVDGRVVDQGIGAPGENGGMGLGMACVHLAVPKRRQVALPLPAHFSPSSVPRDAQTLRHALAAVLVLRNVTLTMQNAARLTAFPGVLQIVAEALQHSMTTQSLVDWNTCADFRVNLLEILESLASRIQLSEWVQSAYTGAGEPEERAVRTEDRVFALLHTLLHTTKDRALLLGSLRCMRAIVSNPANEHVLSETTWSHTPLRLHIIPRCLALLPLTQDPELLESGLDLLYQMIVTGENAILIGALTVAQVSAAVDASSLWQDDADTRPLVDSVVGYLVRNLSLGKTVWERDSVITANTSAPWSAEVPSAARQRRLRERALREKRERLTVEERNQWKTLRPEEKEQLQQMHEPERGIAWMKMLFEQDSLGEVTQMEFWITYRDQFTPMAAHGAAPLQPAANLIRNVSQTFPGAAAMVISPGIGQQPRFIIRGISLRDRSQASFACSWEDCPAPQAPCAEAIKDHLDVHASAAKDGQCRWHNCNANTQDSPDANSLLRQHVRTHMPQPVDDVQLAVPGPPAQGTMDHPGTITFEVERTPSVPSAAPQEGPLPCGVAFLSALVLRFVTRAARNVLKRSGAGCPTHTYGGAQSSSKAPLEGGDMFGCPIPPTMQDANGGLDGVQKAPAVSAAQIAAARDLMNALASREDAMVKVALQNDILCRIISDTLVLIRTPSAEHTM